MVKNRKLSKAITQVGWGMFCTMLKYKAEMEGKVYQEVDRFFASSKTCNVCLNKVESLNLDVRNWVCTNCNTQHDRDVNAAKNIKDVRAAFPKGRSTYNDERTWRGFLA